MDFFLLKASFKYLFEPGWVINHTKIECFYIWQYVVWPPPSPTFVKNLFHLNFLTWGWPPSLLNGQCQQIYCFFLRLPLSKLEQFYDSPCFSHFIFRQIRSSLFSNVPPPIKCFISKKSGKSYTQSHILLIFLGVHYLMLGVRLPGCQLGF